VFREGVKLLMDFVDGHLVKQGPDSLSTSSTLLI
jgi:hypothetical protein